MDCEKQRLASGDCGGNIGFMKAVEQLTPRMTLRKRKWMHVSQTIPQTSMERMQQTVDEKPYDLEHITSLSKDTKETVLYLGYGSNLAAETFLGRRGIRPLSQVNVVAPAIRLTFDLPGIPYSEPCFANSKYRPQPGDPPEAERPPYHKNAWKKGLVGVVYEVTKKDYVHIIATEGGGSGYHDVLVDCFVLDDDPDVEVPMKPTGTAFKAHTLYAHTGERLRPNPDYAQPSPRYLKLITDGADEHNLPTEYRKFLANIRTYHATTTQQSLGSFVYLAVWGPIFAFVFGVAPKIFLRKDGTYPDWFKRLTAAIFVACWASYDQFFFALFGDGERTIGDNVVAHKGEHRTLEWPSEKTPLLPRPSTAIKVLGFFMDMDTASPPVLHDFDESFETLTAEIESQLPGRGIISIKDATIQLFSSTVLPTHQEPLNKLARVFCASTRHGTFFRLNGPAIYLVVALALQFSSSPVLVKMIYYIMDNLAIYKRDTGALAVLQKYVDGESLEKEVKKRQGYIFKPLVLRLRDLLFDESKGTRVRRLAAQFVLALCIDNGKACLNLVHQSEGKQWLFGTLLRKANDFVLRVHLADIVTCLLSNNIKAAEIWDATDARALHFSTSHEIMLYISTKILYVKSGMDLKRRFTADRSVSRIYHVVADNIPRPNATPSRGISLLVLDESITLLTPADNTGRSPHHAIEIPILENMKIMNATERTSAVNIVLDSLRGCYFFRGKKSALTAFYLQFTNESDRNGFKSALEYIYGRLEDSGRSPSELEIRPKKRQRCSIAVVELESETTETADVQGEVLVEHKSWVESVQQGDDPTVHQSSSSDMVVAKQAPSSDVFSKPGNRVMHECEPQGDETSFRGAKILSPQFRNSRSQRPDQSCQWTPESAGDDEQYDPQTSPLKQKGRRNYDGERSQQRASKRRKLTRGKDPTFSQPLSHNDQDFEPFRRTAARANASGTKSSAAAVHASTTPNLKSQESDIGTNIDESTDSAQAGPSRKKPQVTFAATMPRSQVIGNVAALPSDHPTTLSESTHMNKKKSRSRNSAPFSKVNKVADSTKLTSQDTSRERTGPQTANDVSLANIYDIESDSSVDEEAPPKAPKGNRTSKTASAVLKPSAKAKQKRSGVEKVAFQSNAKRSRPRKTNFSHNKSSPSRLSRRSQRTAAKNRVWYKESSESADEQNDERDLFTQVKKRKKEATKSGPRSDVVAEKRQQPTAKCREQLVPKRYQDNVQAGQGEPKRTQDDHSIMPLSDPAQHGADNHGSRSPTTLVRKPPNTQDGAAAEVETEGWAAEDSNPQHNRQRESQANADEVFGMMLFNLTKDQPSISHDTRTSGSATSFRNPEKLVSNANTARSPSLLSPSRPAAKETEQVRRQEQSVQFTMKGKIAPTDKDDTEFSEPRDEYQLPHIDARFNRPHAGKQRATVLGDSATTYTHASSTKRKRGQDSKHLLTRAEEIVHAGKAYSSRVSNNTRKHKANRVDKRFAVQMTLAPATELQTQRKQHSEETASGHPMASGGTSQGGVAGVGKLMSPDSSEALSSKETGPRAPPKPTSAPNGRRLLRYGMNSDASTRQSDQRSLQGAAELNTTPARKAQLIHFGITGAHNQGSSRATKSSRLSRCYDHQKDRSPPCDVVASAAVSPAAESDMQAHNVSFQIRHRLDNDDDEGTTYLEVTDHLQHGAEKLSKSPISPKNRSPPSMMSLNFAQDFVGKSKQRDIDEHPEMELQSKNRPPPSFAHDVTSNEAQYNNNSRDSTWQTQSEGLEHRADKPIYQANLSTVTASAPAEQTISLRPLGHTAGEQSIQLRRCTGKPSADHNPTEKKAVDDDVPCEHEDKPNNHISQGQCHSKIEIPSTTQGPIGMARNRMSDSPIISYSLRAALERRRLAAIHCPSRYQQRVRQKPAPDLSIAQDCTTIARQGDSQEDPLNISSSDSRSESKQESPFEDLILEAVLPLSGSPPSKIQATKIVGSDARKREHLDEELGSLESPEPGQKQVLEDPHQADSPLHLAPDNILKSVQQNLPENVGSIPFSRTMLAGRPTIFTPNQFNFSAVFEANRTSEPKSTFAPDPKLQPHESRFALATTSEHQDKSLHQGSLTLLTAASRRQIKSAIPPPAQRVDRKNRQPVTVPSSSKPVTFPKHGETDWQSFGIQRTRRMPTQSLARLTTETAPLSTPQPFTGYLHAATSPKDGNESFSTSELRRISHSHFDVGGTTLLDSLLCSCHVDPILPSAESTAEISSSLKSSEPLRRLPTVGPAALPRREEVLSATLKPWQQNLEEAVFALTKDVLLRLDEEENLARELVQTYRGSCEETVKGLRQNTSSGVKHHATKMVSSVEALKKKICDGLELVSSPRMKNGKEILEAPDIDVDEIERRDQGLLDMLSKVTC